MLFFLDIQPPRIYAGKNVKKNTAKKIMKKQQQQEIFLS